MKISPTLLARIKSEAERAYPREACGLLAGRPGGGAILEAVASANLAAGDDEFLIDPALHLKTQRRLRARGWAVIGVYHSHPGGDSEPSPADRSGTANPGWLWLIVSLEAGKVGKVSIFREIKETEPLFERNFAKEGLQITETTG